MVDGWSFSYIAAIVIIKSSESKLPDPNSKDNLKSWMITFLFWDWEIWLIWKYLCKLSNSKNMKLKFPKILFVSEQNPNKFKWWSRKPEHRILTSFPTQEKTQRNWWSSSKSTQLLWTLLLSDSQARLNQIKSPNIDFTDEGALFWWLSYIPHLPEGFHL